MGIEDEIINQVINIGPDEEVITINTLADMCANETGFNMSPIYYKAGRPQEVAHATCSSDKARRLLGYKTETSVIDAVKRTADHIRKSGVKPFCYHLPIEIINDKTPKPWTEQLI